MPFLIHIEYTSATKNNLQRVALECYKSFEGFTCESKYAFIELINLVNDRYTKDYPKCSPLKLTPQDHGPNSRSLNPYFSVKPDNTNQSIVVFRLIPVKGKMEEAGVIGFPCNTQTIPTAL